MFEFMSEFLHRGCSGKIRDLLNTPSHHSPYLDPHAAEGVEGGGSGKGGFGVK